MDDFYKEDAPDFSDEDEHTYDAADRVRQLRSQQDAVRGASIRSATKQNPDEARKARDLSEQTKIPERMVKGNADVVEEGIRQQEINEAIQDTTVVKRHMSDPDTAARIHDDAENLAEMERRFGYMTEEFPSLPEFEEASWTDTLFEDRFEKMKIGMAQTAVQARHWINDQAIRDYNIQLRQDPEFAKRMEEKGYTEKHLSFLESESKRLSAASRELDDIYKTLGPWQESMTWMQQQVDSGITSFTTQLPTIGLSIVTGSAAPTLTIMGLRTFFDSYGNGRANGLDHDSASIFGAIDAGIEVGTEMAPERVFASAKGYKTGLKGWAKDFIKQEMIGEQFATLGQSANAYLHGLDEELNRAREDGDIGRFFRIQMERQAGTVIATAVGGGLQSGIGGGIGYVQERMYQKEFQSMTQKQQIEHLVGAARNSKLREQAPRQYYSMVRDMEDEHNVLLDVYFDTEYLEQWLTERGVDVTNLDQENPAYAQLVRTLSEAKDTGNKVMISAAHVAAYMVDQDKFDDLVPHMTTTAGAISQAEIVKEKESRVKQEREAMKIIGEDSDLRVKIDEHVEGIKKELEEAGNYTAEQIELYGDLLATNMYTKFAKLKGHIPEEEIMGMFNIGVEKASTEERVERVLNQDDLTTTILKKNLEESQNIQSLRGDLDKERTALIEELDTLRNPNDNDSYNFDEDEAEFDRFYNEQVAMGDLVDSDKANRLLENQELAPDRKWKGSDAETFREQGKAYQQRVADLNDQIAALDTQQEQIDARTEMILRRVEQMQRENPNRPTDGRELHQDELDQLNEEQSEIEREERVRSAAENEPSLIAQAFDQSGEVTTEFVKPSTDDGRTAMMLGNELYDNMAGLPAITVKEIFQNAFDGVKAALLDKDGNTIIGQGEIEVTVDAVSRTITITDNGIGMSKQTVKKAFLVMGGTEKNSGRDSGGLGIAKMAFLFGNENIYVSTTKDGRTTQFNTTGAVLQKGIRKDSVEGVVISDYESGKPSGTSITVKLPKTFYHPTKGRDVPINFNLREMKEVVEDSPLFENIKTTFTVRNNPRASDKRKGLDRRESSEVVMSGSELPAESYTLLFEYEAAWGKIQVITDKDAMESKPRGHNAYVLSNGLFQFKTSVTDGSGKWTDNNIPHEFFFNIIPNPDMSAEHPGYPFRMDRQGLKELHEQELYKIKSRITSAWVSTLVQDTVNNYGSFRQFEGGVLGQAIREVITDTQKASLDPVDFNGRVNDKSSYSNGVWTNDNRDTLVLNSENLNDGVDRDLGAFQVDYEVDASKPILHNGVNASFVDDSGNQREVDLVHHINDQFGPKGINYMSEMSASVLELRNAIAEVFPRYSDLTGVPVGVSALSNGPDSILWGVNVKVPFNSILINPWATPLDPWLSDVIQTEEMSKSERISAIASSMISTMIHEFVHHTVSAHEIDFILEQQRLTDALHAKWDMAGFRLKMEKLIRENYEVFEYGNRLYETKSIKPSSEFVEGQESSKKIGDRFTTGDLFDTGQEGSDAAGVDSGTRTTETRTESESRPDPIPESYEGLTRINPEETLEFLEARVGQEIDGTGMMQWGMLQDMGIGRVMAQRKDGKIRYLFLSADHKTQKHFESYNNLFKFAEETADKLANKPDAAGAIELDIFEETTHEKPTNDNEQSGPGGSEQFTEYETPTGSPAQSPEERQASDVRVSEETGSQTQSWLEPEQTFNTDQLVQGDYRYSELNDEFMGLIDEAYELSIQEGEIPAPVAGDRQTHKRREAFMAGFREGFNAKDGEKRSFKNPAKVAGYKAGFDARDDSAEEGSWLFGDGLRATMLERQAEAAIQIGKWKEEALKIGQEQDNSDKIIISLFDFSGQWSQPWIDAGYSVYQFDIKSNENLLATEFLERFDEYVRDSGAQIHGIIAAPPCTSFAASGARWWAEEHDVDSREMVEKKYGGWAAEYYSNPLHVATSMAGVAQYFVDAYSPTFFAIENPIGRMQSEMGWPSPQLTFNPYAYGDPYTKKTQIFGNFNGDLPLNPVFPLQGSQIHKLTGFNAADKAARSVTPQGFAYAFFMANHEAGPTRENPMTQDQLDQQTLMSFSEFMSYTNMVTKLQKVYDFPGGWSIDEEVLRNYGEYDNYIKHWEHPLLDEIRELRKNGNFDDIAELQDRVDYDTTLKEKLARARAIVSLVKDLNGAASDAYTLMFENMSDKVAMLERYGFIKDEPETSGPFFNNDGLTDENINRAVTMLMDNHNDDEIILRSGLDGDQLYFLKDAIELEQDESRVAKLEEEIPDPEQVLSDRQELVSQAREFLTNMEANTLEILGELQNGHKKTITWDLTNGSKLVLNLPWAIQSSNLDTSYVSKLYLGWDSINAFVDHDQYLEIPLDTENDYKLSKFVYRNRPAWKIENTRTNETVSYLVQMKSKHKDGAFQLYSVAEDGEVGKQIEGRHKHFHKAVMAPMKFDTSNKKLMKFVKTILDTPRGFSPSSYNSNVDAFHKLLMKNAGMSMAALITRREAAHIVGKETVINAIEMSSKDFNQYLIDSGAGKRADNGLYYLNGIDQGAWDFRKNMAEGNLEWVSMTADEKSISRILDDGPLLDLTTEEAKLEKSIQGRAAKLANADQNKDSKIDEKSGQRELLQSKKAHKAARVTAGLYEYREWTIEQMETGHWNLRPTAQEEWTDAAETLGEAKGLIDMYTEQAENSEPGQRELFSMSQDDLFGPQYEAEEDKSSRHQKYRHGESFVQRAYSAGMSANGDLMKGIEAQAPIGISLDSLSAANLKTLVQYAASGGYVFVDTGAFAVRQRNAKVVEAASKAEQQQAGLFGDETKQEALNDDQVMKQLQTLHDMIQNNGIQPENVMMVMPDAVGDVEETFRLLEKHAEQLQLMMAEGAKFIMPIQTGSGYSADQVYLKVIDILQQGDPNKFVSFITGIPSNADAMSSEDVGKLLKTIRGERIHILGAVSEETAGPRLKQIADSGEAFDITMDANVIRAAISGKGQRDEQIEKALAGIIEKSADPFTPPFYGPKHDDFINDEGVRSGQQGNSRIELPFKEVTRRVEEVQRAVEMLEMGEITKDQYDEIVAEHKPFTPYDAVPKPSSRSDMESALKSSQIPYIGLTDELEAGQPVALRLDIPAYKDHGQWVVTIHGPSKGQSAGKRLAYNSYGAVSNPVFAAPENPAIKTAKGGPKAPYARIEGQWVPMTEDEAIAQAEAALKDPAWAQVGYDPERHSFFWDRETGEPIVGGSEVIQVSGLVLVKDPQYADRADFLYSAPLEEGETPRGRLRFPDGNYLIGLFNAADASTPIHELGHIFLENEIRIFNDPRVPAELKSDEEKILKWFGIESWDQLEDHHHEKWADSFEDYFVTSEAPTPELKRMFRRFSSWLTFVYRRYKSRFQKTELNDEMRNVFDRLLVTEEALEAAKAEQAYGPMFKTAAEAGMAPNVFAKYREEDPDADESAKEKLRVKVLRRLRQTTMKAWKEELADVQEGVRAELENLPVYRAILAIRGDENLQMDRQLVYKILGLPDPKIPKERSVDKVDPEYDTILVAIAKLGGMDRDEAAAMGVDPAMWHKRNPGNYPEEAGKKPIFRAVTGRKGSEKRGMTADAMRERLVELGYLQDSGIDQQTGEGVTDSTINDLMDAIFAEISGEAQYSVHADLSLAFANMPDEYVAEMEQQQRDAKSKAARLRRFMPPLAIRGLSKINTANKIYAHPDAVANLFGYGSADHMLQEILAAKPIDKAVIDRANEIMMERHGDLLNDGTLEQEAMEAVHNIERGEQILAELDALYDKLYPDQAEKKRIRQEIREAARTMIAQAQIGRLRPERFRTAELKAAQEAAVAMAEGDLAKAHEAKSKQYLNFHLYREAVKAKKKADSITKRLAKIEKTKYKPSTHNMEYVKRAKALLAAFDFRRSSKEARAAAQELVKEFNAWVEKENGSQEKASAGAILKFHLDGAVRHYREMTLDELEGLNTVVGNLMATGKSERDEERAKFNAEKKEDAAWINKAAPRKVLPPEGMIEKGFVRSFRVASAYVRKYESIVRQADMMKDMGRMWKQLVRPLLHAARTQAEMQEKVHKDLQKIFEGHGELFSFIGRNALKRHVKLDSGEDFSLSPSAVVAIALNSGNSYNRAALVNMPSPIMTDNDIDKILALVTESEWDLVEQVWDYLDSWWPQIRDLEERTYGVAPPAVRGEPFTLPNGRVIKGGYYPLIRDKDISIRNAVENTGELMAGEDIAQIGRDMLNGKGHYAATKRDMAIERTSWGNQQVLLSVDGLFNHMDMVIHDLSHREAVREVWKTLVHPEVSAALKSRVGDENYQNMLDTVMRVAAGHIMPSELSLISRALRQSRLTITIGSLANSIRTFFMQVLGGLTAQVEMGTGTLLRGAADFYSDPIGNYQMIMEKSSFMRDRMETMNRDTGAVLRELKGIQVNEKVLAASFRPLVAGDMLISTSVWMAAYNDALARVESNAEEDSGFENDQDAIDWADRMVARTQQSGLLMDLSPIEAQSEAVKVFTVMYSAMNAIYQMLVEQGYKAKFGKQATWKSVTNIMYVIIMSALYETYLFDDENEDADFEDTLWRYTKNIATWPLGLIPLARQIGTMIKFGGDAPQAPYERVMEIPGKAYTQIKQGELDQAAIKALGWLGAMFKLPTGAPATRQGAYLVEYAKGDEGTEPEWSTWEFLATGPQDDTEAKKIKVKSNKARKEAREEIERRSR